MNARITIGNATILRLLMGANVNITGQNGLTPYIGSNGNWWIGITDTGFKVVGNDGLTPYIKNGNWWIGEIDTGVAADAQPWTPIFSLAMDGSRYVQKLTSYVGGSGAAPTANIGQYLKSDGTFTSVITEAATYTNAEALSSKVDKGGSDKTLKQVEDEIVQLAGLKEDGIILTNVQVSYQNGFVNSSGVLVTTGIDALKGVVTSLLDSKYVNSIAAQAGYEFRIVNYNNLDQYVGTTPYKSMAVKEDFNSYPSIRIILKRIDGADITTSESTKLNIIFFANKVEIDSTNYATRASMKESVIDGMLIADIANKREIYKKTSSGLKKVLTEDNSLENDEVEIGIPEFTNTSIYPVNGVMARHPSTTTISTLIEVFRPKNERTRIDFDTDVFKVQVFEATAATLESAYNLGTIPSSLTHEFTTDKNKYYILQIYRLNGASFNISQLSEVNLSITGIYVNHVGESARAISDNVFEENILEVADNSEIAIFRNTIETIDDKHIGVDGLPDDMQGNVITRYLKTYGVDEIYLANFSHNFPIWVYDAKRVPIKQIIEREKWVDISGASWVVAMLSDSINTEDTAIVEIRGRYTKNTLKNYIGDYDLQVLEKSLIRKIAASDYNTILSKEPDAIYAIYDDSDINAIADRPIVFKGALDLTQRNQQFFDDFKKGIRENYYTVVHEPINSCRAKNARIAGNGYDTLYKKENVFIENGNMVIVGSKDESGYLSSGFVSTLGKVDAKYCRWEARIKTSNVAGQFPAFWLMPTFKKYANWWVDGGEIDIMEQQNTGLVSWQTLHILGSLGVAHASRPVTNDYHVYSVQIDEDNGVEFYIDPTEADYLNHNFTANYNPAIKNSNDASVWPFDQDYYVIINLQLMDNYVIGGKMEVDWLRITPHHSSSRINYRNWHSGNNKQYFGE